MKVLHRHRTLSIVTSSLLLTEFLFFLLVALSLPIIKPIYIVGVNAHVQPGQPATSVATRLRFGVWGVCLFSALDEEEVHWNPQGLCFGPAVGYQIPASILQSTGYPQLAGDIARALTILLVLHPVVAALSLVGAATSLFLHSHGMHIISLITTIINSFLSSIVLAADLAIAIIAGQKLPGLTGGIFDVEFGNAMYLAIFGVALSWLGVILLSIPVCGCCGMGEWYHRWETKKFKGRSSDPVEMTESR